MARAIHQYSEVEGFLVIFPTASKFVKSRPIFYRYIIIFNLTLQHAAALLVINETKLEIFVNKGPVSLFICIWKCIATVRYEETAFNRVHLLLTYYFFLKEILQIESIKLLYFEGFWRQFEKYLSKTNKNHPFSSRNIFFPSLRNVHRMFECFVITLLKWLKYKNRLIFAYDKILRF